MKAIYVNIFLNSVSSILKAVAGVETKKGEIKKTEGIKNDKLYTMYFMLENGLNGFFAIGFDEEVALKMVEKMTGIKPESLDEMGYSALKEIGEMAKGNAITELSGLGIDCEATETIFGDLNESMDQESISLTMETELGEIENVFYLKKVTS